MSTAEEHVCREQNCQPTQMGFKRVTACRMANIFYNKGKGAWYGVAGAGKIGVIGPINV